MSQYQSAAIKTWFHDEAEENGMFDDHAYLWRHMIGTVPEKDLSKSCVLDYGCNQGGFLQTLFRQRPFRHGLGVDVAQHSLAVARQNNADLPVDFLLPHQIARYSDYVDIAFSHEVLYLLPDLNEHAATIAKTLKKDGTYYAVIGCHTGNPLWDPWRNLIAQTTNLPVFDYSLDDYAQSFWHAGFSVEMMPFNLTDFILIKPGNAYFPAAADSLHYHTSVKTIIRARKGDKRC